MPSAFRASFGARWRLGWVGLTLPEQYEGVGLGMSELCIVLEEAGRQLAPDPGSRPCCWLPSSWRPDGHVADALLVFARVEEGHALFLIDPKTRGVTIQRQSRIDGRNAALIRFEDVPIDAHAIVGQPGAGLASLSRVIDRATVGLCAEMLGGASQAYDDTLEYLKTRKQFGVAIGSFQALAHRAARLYIELALARSAVLAAASCADEGTPEELAKFASLAKARCSEVFVNVASEAIQMHGGIGVTDDFHIGFYFKRARAADVQFGDATHHLRRWAELSRY